MECSSASCRSSRPPNSDASRLPSRNISAGDLRPRTSDVSGHREGRDQKRPHHPSIQPRPEDRHRVTDVSRIREPWRDTGGHQRTPRRSKSRTGGPWRTRRDMGGHRQGSEPWGPGFKSRAPDQKSYSESTLCRLRLPRRVTGEVTDFPGSGRRQPPFKWIAGS
jgi:hypothetical protein